MMSAMALTVRSKIAPIRERTKMGMRDGEAIRRSEGLEKVREG